jgi:hypothetical protein
MSYFQLFFLQFCLYFFASEIKSLGFRDLISFSGHTRASDLLVLLEEIKKERASEVQKKYLLSFAKSWSDLSLEDKNWLSCTFNQSGSFVYKVFFGQDSLIRKCNWSGTNCKEKEVMYSALSDIFFRLYFLKNHYDISQGEDLMLVRKALCLPCYDTKYQDNVCNWLKIISNTKKDYATLVSSTLSGQFLFLRGVFPCWKDFLIY